MNCQSCGMSMAQDTDHGGGRADNPYCKYCTDPSGNLKSREEVREGMINFHMQSFGKTREEAEKEVDTHMGQMPAWQMPAQQAPVSMPAEETPASPDQVVPDQPPAEGTSPVSEIPSQPVETPAPGQSNLPPDEEQV